MGKYHNIDDGEAWRGASELVKAIGNLSVSFSGCVRALRAGSTQSSRRALDDASRFLVSRFLKANSIKAPFYYVTKAFRYEALDGKKHFSIDDIGTLYSREELAAILTLTYLTKRVRSRCKAENWEKIGKLVQDRADIGAYLGLAFPRLGFADCLLTAGLRALAVAFFDISDAKAYKDYRRDLKIKSLPFDMADEMKKWGTTHVHIGSVLLLGLGYGKDYTHAYMNSLTRRLDPAPDSPELRFKVAATWIDALASGNKPDYVKGEEDFAGSEVAVDELFDICTQIRNDGSEEQWLYRGRKDLSPDLTPQLYTPEEAEKYYAKLKGGRGAAAKAAPGGDDDNDSMENIDEEVQESA